MLRRRSQLLALIAGSAIAGVAAQASAGSGATQACTPSWHALATPTGLFFRDVAALSPSDVWAVGETGPPGAYRPRIAHWDGHRLHVAPGFKPSVVKRSSRDKQVSGSLGGIAAVSRDDIWAVGTDGWSSSRPVVEHWDGRVWRVVPTPRLRGSGGLGDVTALSRNDVWAVGQVGTRPLYEHWDGSRWHAIVAGREGASLSAVDGAAGGAMWAVGAQGENGLSVNDILGLAMRWDGRRWKEVPDPADYGGYEGLEAWNGVDVSGREVWGMRANGPSRRSGRGWHDFRVPKGPNLYWDIAAAKPNDVWGVGEKFGPRSSSDPHDLRPVVVHWDGRRWQVRHTPFEHLRGSLNRLSVVSATDVWAAGEHLLVQYSCG